MIDKVYEVGDVADEKYLLVGLYPTIEEAMLHINSCIKEYKSINYCSESYEEIEVRERILGLGDFNDVVYQVTRERVYLEKINRWGWREV